MTAEIVTRVVDRVWNSAMGRRAELLAKWPRGGGFAWENVTVRQSVIAECGLSPDDFRDQVREGLRSKMTGDPDFVVLESDDPVTAADEIGGFIGHQMRVAEGDNPTWSFSFRIGMELVLGGSRGQADESAPG